MKTLKEIAVPGLLLVIALLLVPQRARSVYSSPVSVVNPDTQSAAVNDAPRQTVEYYATLNSCGSIGATDGGLVVPAGKALVIDNVSIMNSVTPQDKAMVFLFTGASEYFFPATYQMTLSGYDYYEGNSRSHIVVPPGTQVIVYFYRETSSGCAYGNVSISGHYIDR